MGPGVVISIIYGDGIETKLGEGGCINLVDQTPLATDIKQGWCEIWWTNGTREKVFDIKRIIIKD